MRSSRTRLRGATAQESDVKAEKRDGDRSGSWARPLIKAAVRDDTLIHRFSAPKPTIAEVARLDPKPLNVRATGLKRVGVNSLHLSRNFTLPSDEFLS